MTIRGGGRRVDVALSPSAPLAELVPGVACLCGAEPPPAVGWTLARAGGPALRLDSSLVEAAVLDGEVLHLVDPASWRAPRVSDLKGTTAEPRRRWTRPAAAGVLTGVGAVSALAVGGLAVPAPAGVVVTVLGVLALRLLGPLAGALVQAATAGLDVRRDQALIESRARRWRWALAMASAGLAAAVAAGVAAMVAGGGGPELALALVATLSLALRARSLRFAADVLPIAAGAGAGLVAVASAAALRLLAGGADPDAIAASLAALGVALAGIGALWTRLPLAPRPPRVAWLAVDLLLLPLALGALGVFAAVAQLVGSIGR